MTPTAFGWPEDLGMPDAARLLASLPPETFREHPAPTPARAPPPGDGAQWGEVLARLDAVLKEIRSSREVWRRAVAALERLAPPSAAVAGGAPSEPAGSRGADPAARIQPLLEYVVRVDGA